MWVALRKRVARVDEAPSESQTEAPPAPVHGDDRLHGDPDARAGDRDGAARVHPRQADRYETGA
jgi:hypothetical protein